MCKLLRCSYLRFSVEFLWKHFLFWKQAPKTEQVMRNIILSTDLNGKMRILINNYVLFTWACFNLLYPSIMDVNFYLFIVYQMYQYTVSYINRRTIFLRKLKTRDRYSLAVQLSSEKIIKFAPRKLFVI